MEKPGTPAVTPRPPAESHSDPSPKSGNGHPRMNVGGSRLKQAPGRATASVAVIDRRKTKPCEYSYDARLTLQRVWAASGGSCGQYLARPLAERLAAMEAEGGSAAVKSNAVVYE